MIKSTSAIALFLFITSLPFAANADLVIDLVRQGNEVVDPNVNVTFDVQLSTFTTVTSTDLLVGFGLDVGASSTMLTNSNTDFSNFSFVLSTDLDGKLGGIVFDGNISDDGRIEFGADLPPFGSDSGISQMDSPITLGHLSVLAPATAGDFVVALNIDRNAPISGGTFALIDDGSDFGLIAPGDLDLNVNSSSFSVSSVPEPSAFALMSVGSILVFGRRRRL